MLNSLIPSRQCIEYFNTRCKASAYLSNRFRNGNCWEIESRNNDNLCPQNFDTRRLKSVMLHVPRSAGSSASARTSKRTLRSYKIVYWVLALTVQRRYISRLWRLFWGEIINVLRSLCKLLFLSDFNNTWTFSSDFSKIPTNYNFMKNRLIAAELFLAVS
jgi:hypothetical protein